MINKPWHIIELCVVCQNAKRNLISCFCRSWLNQCFSKLTRLLLVTKSNMPTNVQVCHNNHCKFERLLYIAVIKSVSLISWSVRLHGKWNTLKSLITLQEKFFIRSVNKPGIISAFLWRQRRRFLLILMIRYLLLSVS